MQDETSISRINIKIKLLANSKSNNPSRVSYTKMLLGRRIISTIVDRYRSNH
jgi:hypothetical protein